MDPNAFLSLISLLESSNNFNTNHQKMKHGIHAGDSAIGEYGLMPNTIDEFQNRRVRDKTYGPDDNILDSLEEDSKRKEFLENNPRIEKNLAEDIAKHVLKNSKGDPEKAAYMWNAGHNKEASDISPNDLDNSDYVSKFRNISNLLDKKIP